MNEIKNKLGLHLIFDIYNCDLDLLNNTDKLMELFRSTINNIEMTIVREEINLFYPYGASGVFILKESHFTFHTWPEYKIISIDVFTCNLNIKIHDLPQLIAKKLNGTVQLNQIIDRGKLKRR